MILEKTPPGGVLKMAKMAKNPSRGGGGTPSPPPPRGGSGRSPDIYQPLKSGKNFFFSVNRGPLYYATLY